MNELIESILSGFTVEAASIPVAYMYYRGHGEPYVVYMQEDADGVLDGDDSLIGYVDYYDFDVYAKGNYLKIIESLREILESNGFIWNPSRSSSDMYETDTGYYHKTLSFSIPRGE